MLTPFSSSKNIANIIIKDISNFLKSSLHIQMLKVDLIYARSSWLNFLGFELQTNSRLNFINLYKKKEVVKRSAKRNVVIANKVILHYVNRLKKVGWQDFYEKIKAYRKNYTKSFLRSTTYDHTVKTEVKVILKKFFEEILSPFQKALQNNKIKDKTLNPLQKLSNGVAIKKRIFYSKTVQKVKNFDLSLQVLILRNLRSIRFNFSNINFLKTISRIESSTFKSAIHLSGALAFYNSKNLHIVKLAQNKVEHDLFNSFKLKKDFIYIKFPKTKILKNLRIRGMLDKKGTPCSYKKLLKSDSISIIAYFKRLCVGIFNLYSLCHNFWDLRELASYYLRHSLLVTLGHKYTLNVNKTIEIFGTDPALYLLTTSMKKNRIVRPLICFFSETEIIKISRRSIRTEDPYILFIKVI